MLTRGLAKKADLSGETGHTTNPRLRGIQTAAEEPASGMMDDAHVFRTTCEPARSRSPKARSVIMNPDPGALNF